MQAKFWCNKHNRWLSGHPLWRLVDSDSTGEEHWTILLSGMWCPEESCSEDNWEIIVDAEPDNSDITVS